MAITKLSSREFNQDTSRAKRAAKRGPVFITDRGRPSHVLLTAEEYERIAGGQKSVADLRGCRKRLKLNLNHLDSWASCTSPRIWADVSPRYQRNF